MGIATLHPSFTNARDTRMACYEHLPIYKQAMDVAVYFEKIVAGFTRYHKYTLGLELRNKSRRVVALIVKANAAHDKWPELLTGDAE